nr:hypothetical protein [Pseudomonas sp. ICMP 564]
MDGKYLVGYLVLHHVHGDWREVLGAHLAEHLPDYMVPAQWVLLEQMPWCSVRTWPNTCRITWCRRSGYCWSRCR